MTLRLRSGQAPQPCFETNKALEQAARRAEQRKSEAIDRLMSALKPEGGLPSVPPSLPAELRRVHWSAEALAKAEARSAKEGR